MEIENIIHYLLIGDLTSGKIIYEMSNTIDAKTIYDINQLFNTYYKQHQHRPENTKVDSYYITITIERIIMISKTEENFPFRQNFELFKKIRDSVPEFSQMSLNWNLALNKNNIKTKISDAITDFFNDINYNNQQIVNTISYNKIKSKINKNYSNNYYNEEEKIKNSLISNNNRSFDADRFSFTQMIQDKNSTNERHNLRGGNHLDKFNKNKRISVKIIDENNEEKTNISKSLIRSSLIVNNNNNNSLNKSGLQPAEMSNSLLRELQDLIWQITCCKKIIIFFLIFIIIAQIVVIPIIINNCYSY